MAFYKRFLRHASYQALQQHVSSAQQSLLKILSPPYCSHCYALLSDWNVFCIECTALIHPIASSKLFITNNFSIRVFAITGYEDPLKRLIVSKSWSDYISGYQLGMLVWEHTYIKNVDFDLIVPIPLHWTRYAWRGYNQAYQMGNALAHKSKKPCKNLLIRRRSTVFQSSLPIADRSANVSKIFSLKKSSLQYENKNILIVDDLMTTGSTLKEAAKELLKMKPATITAVVACRAL